MLQDPREGDILDFYGPCDHDPLGKAEVQRQQADRRRQFTRPADLARHWKQMTRADRDVIHDLERLVFQSGRQSRRSHCGGD